VAPHVTLYLLIAPVLLVFVKDDRLKLTPLETGRVRMQPTLGRLTEPLTQQVHGVLSPGTRALLNPATVQRIADLPNLSNLPDLSGASGSAGH
jgi:hypothetical protein